MKLTVLGKYGPYPPAGGATSGYLLEEGETRVLVECGSGVLSRLQRFVPIERLDAIVLSHLHSDHTADLFILRYALQNAKTQLRVLLPPNPAEEFDRIAGCPPFAAEKIQEGAAVNIGAFSFAFVRMTHPFESFGMRVTDGRHTLVYTGDSNWNSRAVSFARGCDLLLADTGFDPEYGARPLRRVIRSQVEDAAAELLLNGVLPQGAAVRAQAREGALSLSPVLPAVQSLTTGEKEV